MEDVERDLRVPGRQCRLLSNRRAVCLVTESWLRAVVNGRLQSVESPLWPSLTDSECNLLLAPSNSILPKPWVRISVKVIYKRRTQVLSLVEEALCSKLHSDSVLDLLAFIHRETFCHTWQQSNDKYKLANVPPGINKYKPVQKNYNDVIRQVLVTVFKCKLYSLSSCTAIQETTGSTEHCNISEAYCIIESGSVFYVLQPYYVYCVHDCVTFSPSKLSGSYAKPLFVIYQLLQAICHAHQLGVAVGDIGLSDLLIDDRLWLRLAFPQLHRLCLPVSSPDLESSCQTFTAVSQGNLTLDSLASLVQDWVKGHISNYDYLMALNQLAGRHCGDPNNHPILPWVIDFQHPDRGFRDLSKSKFRLNKGDRQLDLTYDTSVPFPGDNSSVLRNVQVPHHISDVLSDITYYVYMARRTPKSVLCTYVRSKWVPNEYPANMQRLQEWTPDECIPEFFSDPSIFKSIHDDLPDLEVPLWANDPEDFIKKHKAILESDHVSCRLHLWIDLTFGYKLSGSAAVKAKNVCLQLVDSHTRLCNHGVAQLFTQPHPPKQINAVVATRVPPLFRRPPSKHGDKSDFPPDKSRGRQENNDKTVIRLEESTISLPKGYDPIAPLEQLECLYNFTSRVAHQPKPGIATINEWPGTNNMKDKLVLRDMQALGCVLVELFMSQRLRVLGKNASLLDRYSAIRCLASRISDEVPRPVRSCIQALLQLQKPWEPAQDSNSLVEPLLQYESVSETGLPPPSCNLLLHPKAGLLYFPVYFPALYAMLSKLKKMASEITAIQLSEQTQVDKMQQIHLISMDRVAVLSSFVPRMAHRLGKEGLELLVPYVLDMFVDPLTSIQALWSLFNPVSQALGPQETAQQLLSHLTAIFDAEFTTVKHMKLYHRSFIIQLLVRLGMEIFLNHFATLLIEACAGFKNFMGDSDHGRQFSDSDYFEQGYMNGDYPEVFVDGVIDTEESSQSQAPDTDDRAEQTPIGEEVFPDDMSLDGQEDLKPAPAERTSSESGSIDLADDTQSVNSIGNPHDLANDDISVSSADQLEDMLSRSVGRLSVHSVSRLINSDAEKSQESDASVEEEAELSKAHPSSGSLVCEEDIASDTPTATPSVIHSQTEEFTSSLINNNMGLEYNISDVSAETIKWLSHRLGPVLTAKHLSRNLLRMLALCYLGEEQLEATSRKDHWMPLSATQKYVVGDSHASQVLECLACIAVLYGEHVVLIQYFPHLRELLLVAQKRLTFRAEASLLGCASLIAHIIPYLSDSTLMDILQDVIFKDLVFPLLKILCANHISFPSGSLARQVLSYKIVDILYIISLRIGFEMTREHMTVVLQKFFAAFSVVYDENFQKQSSVAAAAPMKSAEKSVDKPASVSDGDVYFEIKVDSETKEYKIGCAIKPEAQISMAESHIHKHQRQGSGTYKYSLCPPQEEKAAEEAETPIESTDQEKIYQELLETFTPELAHNAYIPFCRLAGGIHMEQKLLNDDLIRQLCALHDEAVSLQNKDRHAKVDSTSSSKDGQDTKSLHDDKNLVSGSFGHSVSMTGNKIMIQSVESDDAELDSKLSPVNYGNRHKSDSAISFSKVKSPEMDINKQRHIKGNWLAYWEHEIGLSEREISFNFKQIKLQTFTGHGNSVRSLCVLDNENSFFSASKDKTVKLWSLRNSGDGNNRIGCQWTYGQHKKSVFAVTFLEGPRLAASCDGIVHTWDPFVGMNVRQYESPRNIPVTVVTPMQSPNTTLITATTDGALRFLDLRSAVYTHEFKCTTGPAGLIRCIACNSDSHWVAVGYSSGVISMLDVRTGVLFASWKGHEGEILQMKAFNKKSLVTSSFDQCMALWNVDDARLLCHLKGPTEPVHCFNFFHNEIISATTGNRIGVHTSVDKQASFISSKLRSDVMRGVLTTMSVLPLNKLLLLGTDNGSIRLLA